MDGIVLLKDDHKTVEKLFKQFEKAGDNEHADKRKIADKVIEELTTHAWIEEKIFYLAAREAAPDTKDHATSWKASRSTTSCCGCSPN
ncbi:MULTISPECIES: hemerythrin domain-containing protein [unclassified Streptomyces]|uniref:hemerythrin domain-containing protein n=1 Tax=unclassified Streptomyces TaxID=2593676 RepID=UPI0032479509|nr:hemerythrin domain-containing protein [Streptomyces sp. NBC_00998]